ncbi:molybdopterin molybdotransferase MoeA [Campylobacter sp.]|uniref:molybdopterin molybdotransferase MoeA n=1 Tax=Campylobacter sp. TaxID=205 RepID=UPI0026FF1C0C|nr:molybdopterin molybdotransferase MoeA [Campylobacter sp.]
MLVNEAVKSILKDLNLKKRSEFVSINDAVGKILADDIIAIKDLPAFDNSALDGYAFKFEDKDTPLKVIDAIFAGDSKETRIKNGECIKIMTGAKMPKGADTVARLEDVDIQNEKVIISSKTRAYDAFRHRGEEVKSGEILINSSTKLTPAHIMMLAAQGISFVRVFSAPKVGIFSSGDEIVEPWQNANKDQIYNANAAAVAAILSNFGYKSSYLGIIKDDFDETVNSLKDADYDVLITSGGASKGEADYMKTALLSLGFKELFDHINVRPGRPCKAYINDKKIVIILPGNPMAAFLLAFLVVVPLLEGKNLPLLRAKIMQDLKIKSGRQNIVLGELKDDEFHVTDDNKFGSGMIMPLVKSNAIYLSSFDQGEIKRGEEVFVYKIS